MVRKSNRESTTPNTPHSPGNARPTSTILTGRLEARPHNARPPWCESETEADQDTRKTARQRGAGHGFVPEEPYGSVSRPAQGPCRASPGGPMWSALPATRQAAGARSAWSPSSESPPYDHADRATLGRQGRPRRPGMTEPRIHDCDDCRDGVSPPIRLLPVSNATAKSDTLQATPRRHSNAMALRSLRWMLLATFAMQPRDGAMYLRLSALSAVTPCDGCDVLAPLAPSRFNPMAMNPHRP